MSVCAYAPDEYGEALALYKVVVGDMPALVEIVPVEDMPLLLQTIQYANCMALALAYNAAASPGFANLDAAFEAGTTDKTGRAAREELRLTLRMFRYNTETNAGTACLPGKYAQALDALIDALEAAKHAALPADIRKALEARKAQQAQNEADRLALIAEDDAFLQAEADREATEARPVDAPLFYPGQVRLF